MKMVHPFSLSLPLCCPSVAVSRSVAPPPGVCEARRLKSFDPPDLDAGLLEDTGPFALDKVGRFLDAL